MKFEIQDIPLDIENRMIEKNVWSSECMIPIQRLKLINVSHYNFEYEVSGVFSFDFFSFEIIAVIVVVLLLILALSKI